MTRTKHASSHSHRRHPNPPQFSSRIYAHSTTPTRGGPRYQRHHNLKQKHGRKSRAFYEDGSEDTYLSFLRNISDTEDGEDNASSDGSDIGTGDDDQDWDEEATLVEMLASPAYNEEHVLQALGRAFADASHDIREKIILGIGPALKSARKARPAPGRAFITGYLGFDNACKTFEEGTNRHGELDAAYAKIEGEIEELFERLHAACRRIEERRAVFQKQVKEKTNEMREIINALPAEVDTLLAKLEQKYKDMDMDEGSTVKKKGREKVIEGALEELKL